MNDKDELEQAFLQLCTALGMPEDDPLLYARIQQSIQTLTQKNTKIIAQSIDNDQEWLADIRLQAIDIIEKLLMALSKERTERKVIIPKNSDRYKVLYSNTQKIFAEIEAMRAAGNVSIAQLNTLIARNAEARKELATERAFSSLLDKMMSKTQAKITAEIKAAQDPITKLQSKELLAMVAPFFESLSEANAIEYPIQLENYFTNNTEAFAERGITKEQQQQFFDGANLRLKAAQESYGASSVIQLLKMLDVADLDGLFKLADNSDTLCELILNKLNTPAKIDARLQDKLGADPELLFNIIIKTASDMAGYDSNQSEKSYFSKNKLSVDTKKIHAMYDAVMQVLDFDLHTSQSKYQDLKQHKKVNYVLSNQSKSLTRSNSAKLETKIISNYNELLQTLENYANILEDLALEINDHEHADQFASIANQIHAVYPFKRTNITDKNIRTLIDLSASTIEISRKFETKYNMISHENSARFSKYSNNIIDMILQSLSSIIQAAQKLFGFRGQTSIHPTAINRFEKMQHQLLHKTQNLRSEN